jgi:tRNA 2-thiouridine synthesizing protein E
MSSVESRFNIDSAGFLVDFEDWSEDFALEMAQLYGIPDGLTERHWQVIHFIRDTFQTYGQCPLLYQTCRANRLSLRELQALFPTGYLRGACRLAGVTYRHGYHATGSPPHAISRPHGVVEAEAAAATPGQSYTTDVRGFLLDPSQWNRDWAEHRARDLKMPTLGERHWQIIVYLRLRHERDRVVPTVYETCAANDLDIEDLEKLFPDGYHRGAVRIAGLRAL